MPVTVDGLELGTPYSRPELAQLWGYKDWHALGRGVVTPKDQQCLVLFVTKENQESLTAYSNYFENDLLHCEGETSRQNDGRIIGAKSAGEKIYLFFRNKDHMPFTYYGDVELVRHNEDPNGGTTKFVYSTRRLETLDETAAATERITHGIDEITGDSEGAKKLKEHWVYERSTRNRRIALEIHGRICKVCGFDFDATYGQDVANSYIEVHHINSLAQSSGAINPGTDLIPLCSNCHSMAHRKRPKPFTPEELKKFIVETQKAPK
jgi:5-methylcytosine-specific restriction enzyme A